MYAFRTSTRTLAGSRAAVRDIGEAVAPYRGQLAGLAKPLPSGRVHHSASESHQGRFRPARDFLRRPERPLAHGSAPGLGLSPLPAAAGELVLASGIEFTGAGNALQILRFAGANRLVVEFVYNKKRRRVEPYSLRRPATGNLLLYGIEQDAGRIKAFKVHEMTGVTATSAPFTPSYAVEHAAHGPLGAPAPARRLGGSSRRTAGLASTTRRFVVECTTCGGLMVEVR